VFGCETFVLAQAGVGRFLWRTATQHWACHRAKSGPKPQLHSVLAPRIITALQHCVPWLQDMHQSVRAVPTTILLQIFGSIRSQLKQKWTPVGVIRRPTKQGCTPVEHAWLPLAQSRTCRTKAIASDTSPMHAKLTAFAVSGQPDTVPKLAQPLSNLVCPMSCRSPVGHYCWKAKQG
jgi:hypothetical protein